ncbi:photosystem II 5 kDa protein, chloroplastic-like [Eucalyptus grandis]|uniref:Photosystem II 5 kDa protein, chloroplastic n=1 Tax=Eucalyptus globulus TaxID=34317 RepID=A0ABD3LNG1_EUCGL|nr:photosystem II 5 kDa protein, chloroplastic [Eucalyptus grandis]XP_039170865.1 photosystem II 5 kDa protein, chloroplastic-like [Eucalyptus grandis]
MASMTMTASFLAGSSAVVGKLPSAKVSRGLFVAKASRATEAEKASLEVDATKEERANGRRDLVFAAAAAAACAVARAAVAEEEEEPRRGTPEAKKKYAPICVTMPTARVCRK